MNYFSERALLLKKMSVDGKILMVVGIVIGIVAAVSGSAWALAGLAIGWLGYSAWKLQRNYYKNGKIRVIESVDAFKVLPKRYLKKPNEFLTGTELEDFYEKFGHHQKAMFLLKNKDITHHLAINTELQIRQYYEPQLRREQEQAKFTDIKDKINTSN